MGLTQVEFAKRLGCAQGHLSEIEADKYAPSVFFLACIGHAFPAVDLRWVIMGDGSMFKSGTNEAVAGTSSYGINRGINAGINRPPKRP